MGNTRSKIDLNNFATCYLNYVQINPISNIPTITQIHHLMLFVSEHGEKYYFNKDCTYFTGYFDKVQIAHIFPCHTQPENIRLHETLYLLCKSYLCIKQTHGKCYINMFCNELNTLLKHNAIRLLKEYTHIDTQDLQNKLVEYETALETVKQKLTTSNITNSNELLLEGYNIQKNIDETNKQLADANLQNEIKHKYERFIEIIKVEQPHEDKTANVSDDADEIGLLLKND
jgi:hypothetical protein